MYHWVEIGVSFVSNTKNWNLLSFISKNTFHHDLYVPMQINWGYLSNNDASCDCGTKTQSMAYLLRCHPFGTEVQSQGPCGVQQCCKEMCTALAEVKHIACVWIQ